MDRRKEIDNEKMFNLKEWVSIQEATRHIAMLYDGEFNENDILKLALKGKLKLSLFLSRTPARPCQLIDKEEIDSNKSDYVNEDGTLKGYFWEAIDKYIMPMDTKNHPVLIDNVHNLIMAGLAPHELGDMLRQVGVLYNPMPNFGSQVELYLGSPGVLVGEENGKIYELMQRRLFENLIIKGNQEMEADNQRTYVPMIRLPLSESALVVRTSELIQLERSLRVEDSEEEKQQGQEEKKTDLAKILDPTHSWYSENLAIAINCWIELYANREGNKSDNRYRLPGGNTLLIKRWFDLNKGSIRPTTEEHFRVIINPSKQGGPSKFS
jgi:hypothetical protein